MSDKSKKPIQKEELMKATGGSGAVNHDSHLGPLPPNNVAGGGRSDSSRQFRSTSTGGRVR